MQIPFNNLFQYFLNFDIYMFFGNSLLNFTLEIPYFWDLYFFWKIPLLFTQEIPLFCHLYSICKILFKIYLFTNANKTFAIKTLYFWHVHFICIFVCFVIPLFLHLHFIGKFPSIFYFGDHLFFASSFILKTTLKKKILKKSICFVIFILFTNSTLTLGIVFGLRKQTFRYKISRKCW